VAIALGVVLKVGLGLAAREPEARGLGDVHGVGGVFARRVRPRLMS
jgi:hypothetical protein